MPIHSPSSHTDSFTLEHASELIGRLISDPDQPLVAFMVDWCEFCEAARNVFTSLKVNYRLVDLDSDEYRANGRGRTVRQALLQRTGSRTVPQIFASGVFVGGATDVFDELRDGTFLARLQEAGLSFHPPSDPDPYHQLPHRQAP